jgi:hypothetical protein
VRQDAYSGTAPCAHRARRHIDTRDLFKFYSKQTPTFGKIIRRFDTYRAEEGEARKRRVIGFLGTNISPRDLQFNMRDAVKDLVNTGRRRENKIIVHLGFIYDG